MVLYRGVNPELHNQTAGELLPKNDRPFVRSPEYGRAEYGNSFWGKCAENAVVEHQLHQAGYPTSGVSTTPHLSRAIFYATQDGKYPNGFVYVIDESQCQIHNVTIHIVKDIVPIPSIPEDDEIILVAHDFGVLPRALIIEIKNVSA